MKRLTAFLLVALAACSSPSMITVAELPDLNPAGLQSILIQSSQPVVLNVWASWCIPCRSEAPLLEAAYRSFGDDVLFIGIDVQDTQSRAQEFLSEFEITFDNYFDVDRAIPSELGGIGVPITYFFTADGEMTFRHDGVIDERTLALQIDELLNR